MLVLLLSVAQMGWILGHIALIVCAYITYYTAVLLSYCYRSPEPVHGKRNYTCTWTPSAPVSVTNNPQINFYWHVWMDIGSMHTCC